jgi:serine phosphatase RsbU (regulator of sigma subunit)
MRILIVDDSQVARLHLELLLREAGYTDLVIADAPQRALRLLGATGSDEALPPGAVQDGATPFDLVLLDVVMPQMSGVEVCRRLKALERLQDIPVIMVTAQTETEHLQAAFEAGAMDYITKPADEVELLVRVRSALRLKQEIDRRRARERQLDEQRQQLQAELVRAALVQAELLPRQAPPLPGFELAARCIPAREVGGDFYDWQQSAPNTLTLTLGDVMGKGMPAALLMATVRAALRAVARQSPPAVTIQSAAAALEVDLARAGSFVTLFHCYLDAPRRLLHYVDAGHGHVFMHRGNHEPAELPARGLPVGVIPDHQYREDAITFRPGDTLVVYSDGLLDARPDLALQPAKLARRLDGASGAAEVVERLLAAAALTGPPPDDLTVVALRCQDEPGDAPGDAPRRDR